MESITPLHTDDAVGASAQMIETDLVEFLLSRDAVQIGVIQGQATAVILIDEGKGWTGDALLGRNLQAPGDALDEECFASTEVTDQTDEIAGLETGSQTLPRTFGFVRTMPLVLGMLDHLAHI